jgi:serine/threonine-protein kinase
MATIHRAIDVRLDRPVAVKLLRPEVASDADLAQRFRREALAATVLRHPNVVACLDTGTDTGGPDGDQPFLVMELIEGEDLAARLRRGGRLAPHQAARIALDVARGLGVAHVRGIVHRDVKPGNILLATDGRAMVTDFGIARLAMDAEAALPGTTLGSVHYFSPEQARGATTTPASDVYGLGLVLFEALTGQRPWSGETNDAIALARVGTTAPRVDTLRPEVPIALVDVVARALAPDPATRFPNGQTMAGALDAIVAALDPASPTLVHTLAPPARPASTGIVVDPVAASPGAIAAHAPVVTPRPIDWSIDEPMPAPLTPVAVGAPSSGTTPALPNAGAPVVPVRPGGARIPVLGAVAGILLVAVLAIAALADADDGRASGPRASDGAAAVLPTTAPVATATPAPTSSPSPTASPTPRPEPTPDVTPRPTRNDPDGPARAGADLCETYFSLPCGLDAGRYAPSRFETPFTIELGGGWSNALHTAHAVVMERDEGWLAFLDGALVIDPERGRPVGAGARAVDVIETLITLDGVSSTDKRSVRIGGERGFSIDLSPIGDDRIAAFANEDVTYFLEPAAMTRIVCMDVDGHVVVIIIEPSADADLRGILDTADGAAGTIAWQ